MGGQAIPSEAEVLLPAGIALKVTGVLPQDGGLTIVTLEDDDEVGTPLFARAMACRCSLSCHRLCRRRSW